jgi:hypothetical protein
VTSGFVTCVTDMPYALSIALLRPECPTRLTSLATGWGENPVPSGAGGVKQLSPALQRWVT